MLIVAYLYDDIEPGERAGVRSAPGHVRALPHRAGGARAACARSWRAGRRPSRSSGIAGDAIVATDRSRIGRRRNRESDEPTQWWRDVPAWAQVAAALLVLGVVGRHREPRRALRRERPDDPHRLVEAAADAVAAAVSRGAVRPLIRASAPWRAELDGARAAAAKRDSARRRVAAQSPVANAGGACVGDRRRCACGACGRWSTRASGGSSASSRCASPRSLRDVNAQRQADLRKIDQQPRRVPGPDRRRGAAATVRSSTTSCSACRSSRSRGIS